MDWLSRIHSVHRNAQTQCQKNNEDIPLHSQASHPRQRICDSEHSESILSTNGHVDEELSPIVGYSRVPLLPLNDACEPLFDVVSDLQKYVGMALEKTEEKPPDNLTRDESAAILLYTMEWELSQKSLYCILNQALRIQNREHLQLWFKYLKLLLTALVKIECSPRATIWRGMTKNISNEFPPKKLITWWHFSSCTPSGDVLENDIYLGQNGERTLFSIEAFNARKIKSHSDYISEDELLLLPGTFMEVQSRFNPAPDLYIIHLKQIEPPTMLLEPPFEGAKIYPRTAQHGDSRWYQNWKIMIPINLLVASIVIAVVFAVVFTLRSTNNGEIYPPILVSSTYASALTVESEQFCRVANCSTSAYYYQAFRVKIFDAGYYSFFSSSNMDTFGAMYADHFLPSDPSLKQINADDDGGDNKQFLFKTWLDTAVTYYLVVTTYFPGVTGSFLVNATGTAKVEFIPINASNNTRLFTSQFSSALTNHSGRFCRFGDCSTFIYFYEAFLVNVSQVGPYSFQSNSTMNTFGYVYNSFVNTSSLNLMALNHDGAGNEQFRLSVWLDTSRLYLLVVTTYSPNIMGPFSITATGWGSVTLFPWNPPDLTCEIRYTSMVSYTTGSNSPDSVAVGDFNKDNILDVAAARYHGNNTAIFLGFGDGTLSTATMFPAGSNPWGITVADFNDDDRLDLAVANGFENNVGILFGYGNGSFRAQKELPTGRDPWALAVDDFNSDQYLDIVAVNYASNTLTVFLGYGNERFSNQSTYSTDSGPANIVVGDFNEDSRVDIATINQKSSNVGLFLGYGNGTFADQVTFSTGSEPTSIASADFNSDGHLDIIVSSGRDSMIYLHLGYGNGTFTTASTFSTYHNPQCIIASDLNKDNRVDVIVANYGSANVNVFLGRGDGTFGVPFTFLTGSNPQSVTVGDLNNDGRLDIIVANEGSSTVGILLNTCTCCAP